MLLEVRGLKLVLGSSEVLRNLNFKLERGETVGLLGPNGSGKSTLLRAIFGVLKPVEGVIYVDGKNISELNIREIARKMGYLPQESAESRLTVRDVVLLGRTPYIDSLKIKPVDIKIAEEALEAVGLSGFEDRKFSELSGGEKQKVLLARVFAQKSEILLLDEPTSHLDISSQIEIMSLIKKRIKDYGSAIIAIHDINLASAYCDKLLLIKRGRIVKAGVPEAVITRESIRDVFGADVEVKNFGGRIHIVPAARRSAISNIRVHIICGGGSGNNVIRNLWEKGFMISAGVLNVLDSDWVTVTELKGDVIDEPPFSKISEKSHSENLEMIKKSDFVILTNLSVGEGNLKNLEAALAAAESEKLFILEKDDFDSRNFAGERAKRLYEKILNLTQENRRFNNETELIRAIEVLLSDKRFTDAS
jgi:iron complex transport system ATP-binding protein